MVYGLRPPALDALGLAGALRMLATQHPRLELDVFAPDVLPPLPAAVEVAVYRIAAEALSNITTHAGATAARLRLVWKRRVGAARGLRLRIGHARRPGHRRGPHLDAGASGRTGGTLVVAAGVPHGTIITAVLPYRSLDRQPSQDG